MKRRWGRPSRGAGTTAQGPVLYVVDHFPSYTETFIAQEIDGLVRRGVQVLVYAMHAGPAELPAPSILLMPPARRWELVGRLYTAWQAIPLLIRRQISRREVARLAYAGAHAARAEGPGRAASVSHIHSHFLVRPSDVARLLARRLGVGWTATGHAGDVYDSSLEPGLQALRLSEVAAVACISRDVQTRLPASVRTRIVHCGVDSESLRAIGPAVQGGPRRFVTVGRLHEPKGYRTVLEAARILSDRNEDFQWDLVGAGPLREEIDRFIAERGLTGRVIPLGPLPRQEAIARVAGAAALVLPCQQTPVRLSDGIPVVLMEAMAIGTLVVTTPVAGIPELVVDGVNGLLVPPSDPVRLADVLQGLRGRNVDLLLTDARRTVADRFTVDGQVARMADLFAEVARCG